MTNEEAFKISANGLLKQGRKSVGSTENAVLMGLGYCRYRGDHGRKCAIGLLIPDEEYSVHMEPFGIPVLRTQCPPPSPAAK